MRSCALPHAHIYTRTKDTDEVCAAGRGCNDHICFPACNYVVSSLLVRAKLSLCYCVSSNRRCLHFHVVCYDYVFPCPKSHGIEMMHRNDVVYSLSLSTETLNSLQCFSLISQFLTLFCGILVNALCYLSNGLSSPLSKNKSEKCCSFRNRPVTYT